MNNIEKIVPKILARGLMALRERMVLPRLVNADFNEEARKKGDTIDVPFSTEKQVKDVVPSHEHPAPSGTTTKTIPIKLDEWKQTDFYLTDKDMTKIDANKTFIPMEMQEAINALARYANGFIHSQYKRVYGFVGTPGVTPFGSSGDAAGVRGATQSRKVLNAQQAPKSNRVGVLDFDAEAEALALAQFSDAEKIGSSDVKVDGEIGKKYGIGWFSDDQVLTHSAGSLTGAPAVQGANAVGAETVVVATATGEAINLVEGDIITFAGDSQTYAVTEDLNVGASATGSLSITPGLKQATTGGEAIAVKGDHVVNLVFQRDAFAFAQRPLVTEATTSGNQIFTMTDPQTGISLRLEITRQHKQTVWEFDILFGAALVENAKATRLVG